MALTLLGGGCYYYYCSRHYRHQYPSLPQFLQFPLGWVKPLAVLIRPAVALLVVVLESAFPKLPNRVVFVFKFAARLLPLAYRALALF